MGCEDDVLTVAKKLEKLIATKSTDHSSAVDLLKTLQNLPMTLEVLQKTRIGMIVNNFRKAATEEENITLSKALIKTWKKLLAENNTPANASSKSDKIDGKDDSSRDSFCDGQNHDSSKSRDDIDSNSSTSCGTYDPVRIKCRELIKNALKAGELPEGSKDANELAVAIETSVYEEFRNTDTRYKNRIRSRVANLRDQKNPKFRENVLIGALDPSRVASMTSEEMASDDMKNLRAKFTKEAIEDHQMAMQGGTKSSLLKCGRCLKYDCTYNQVQTRSADEPMTTFVLCNACGNRWRFC